jgi:PAS domain S-box-containing protein
VPVGARAALAMVRPLWDRSSAGWFVYAGDGRLLYANAAVEEIIGAKVTVGSTALVPPVVPESRLAYQRVVKRLRSDPACGATAITLAVPVGNECRLVNASLLAAPDAGGFGHAVIGMLQDVTARAEPGRDAALERLSHLERVLARIASDLAGVAPSHEERLPLVDGLSPRQREILQKLLAGERPAAIARQLHLSVHTVRNHTKAIFRVFGVHSQSELLVHIRNHVRNDALPVDTSHSPLS